MKHKNVSLKKRKKNKEISFTSISIDENSKTQNTLLNAIEHNYDNNRIQKTGWRLLIILKIITITKFM